MSLPRFKNIIEVGKYFEDKQTCIDHLTEIRWNGKICCTFCKHDKVYGLKGKFKRFKCGRCRKQFSAIKGTIFENSPISLQKWFMAVYLISSRRKSVSSLQLADDISVTQKTAWFMSQRIRYALKISSFEPPKDGLFQADETYVGGKNKNRHADKRIPKSQGRSLKDKTPVFGIIQPDGKLHIQVVPDTTRATVEKVLQKFAKDGAIIITDEWKAYKRLHQKYDHVMLLHSNEEYTRGAFHNNTIEGAYGLFKRNLDGIHHWVSKKHLQRYCDEFMHRYNTKGSNSYIKFNTALKNAASRLTYKQLIARVEEVQQ